MGVLWNLGADVRTLVNNVDMRGNNSSSLCNPISNWGITHAVLPQPLLGILTQCPSSYHPLNPQPSRSMEEPQPCPASPFYQFLHPSSWTTLPAVSASLQPLPHCYGIAPAIHFVGTCTPVQCTGPPQGLMGFAMGLLWSCDNPLLILYSLPYSPLAFVNLVCECVYVGC